MAIDKIKVLTKHANNENEITLKVPEGVIVKANSSMSLANSEFDHLSFAGSNTTSDHIIPTLPMMPTL